jgi:hypothetical protein
MTYMRSICLLFLLTISSLIHAAQQYSDQKVVYHMNYDDESRIAETMTNISNHLQAADEDKIDIKVVVHGKAIEYFMAATDDEAKQITLDSLRLRDVQFIICGNTLDGYKITRKDLYDVEEEDVVQAGLPTIIDLQQKGYLYVRP